MLKGVLVDVGRNGGRKNHRTRGGSRSRIEGSCLIDIFVHDLLLAVVVLRRQRRSKSHSAEQRWKSKASHYAGTRSSPVEQYY
jgi:hypothetical protein